MNTDSIASVFTKNNQRPTTIEEIHREATSLLDNSRRLGAQLLRRVSAVSTFQPHLQQEYIDSIIETLNPSERLETFIRASATTLSDPPQTHVVDALPLITSAEQLLQAVPENPDIQSIINADAQQIVDNIAHSIAGAMVHQTTLDDEQRDLYIDAVSKHIASQNLALAVIAKTMHAVFYMTSWRSAAPSVTDIATISLRTDQELDQTNYFRQRRTSPQTPQEFSEICINHSILRHCTSVMNDSTYDAEDPRINAIKYWMEVQANLPSKHSYWNVE